MKPLGRHLLLLSLILLTSLACSESGGEAPPTFVETEIADSGEQHVQYSNGASPTAQELEQQAFLAMGAKDRARALELWEQVLTLNPRSGNAHAQIGLAGLYSSNYQEQERGVSLLERAFFEPALVEPTIPMPSQQGIVILSTVGRWRWERAEYELAARAFRVAWKATRFGDVCLATQIATMLHPYPNSTQHADQMMQLYMKNSEFLLKQLRQKPLWRIDHHLLMQQVGGAAEDPYVHCLLTIFHLSFYYRADVARASRLHYEIATTLWPQLQYTAPKYKNWKMPLRDKKPCAGKIRLGIASGALSLHHSVSSDFKGVQMRLDRRKFDVTFIYFDEVNTPVDPYVYTHPQDEVVILKRQNDERTDAALQRYRTTIQNLDLDVLLYLDLTMSSHARRTGLAKLAAVQATTHGHPLTSGIPRDIVNYYISWEAAELEHSVAQHHYTEELVLLSKDVPHQYYGPRSNGTHSLINGMAYAPLLDRTKFFQTYDQRPPVDANWYVCMQKPHKFQPEVDELFCGVLANDPDGILILHREERSPRNHERLMRRLSAAGCHVKRVYFIGSLDHHRLLALYSLANVVLDSYPAGGCTTTREVLELHQVLVTLPARLLGGRWSYAYYQMLDDAQLVDLVVADSVDAYIHKAASLGRNRTLQQEAQRRIHRSLHRLYGRKESVESWERVLLEIAPVSLDPERCVCV